MQKFSYTVASSILHDAKAVEAIFSRYQPLLEAAGGRRINAPADAPEKEPVFFFVLTGGTESVVLPQIQEAQLLAKRLPVVLLAHPHQNSLPASLEILAKIQQDGGEGTIVLVKSDKDEQAKLEIEKLANIFAALMRVRSAVIGAIGEASDWLVASRHSPETVKKSWGATIVPVDFLELKEKIDAIRKANEDENYGAAAAKFLTNASFVRESKPSDLYKSDTIYRAIRDIVAERNLDAITLRCFDLVLLDQSTGCFALSQLADEGIDAGCEGDIPAILALVWMRALSGKPAWMANPADILPAANASAGRGTMLLAHCTVPRTLLTGYGVRSHFESGLGVAVAGTMPQGPVTVVRIGGTGLDSVFLAEGTIIASPHEEGLCRTQAVIEMDGAALTELLEKPLGNHLVVVPGHWADAGRKYLKLSGLGRKA